MAYKVDEQVVRMSFDNNKFNTNVKDTTNALDSLDNKLGALEKNNALDKMSKDMSGLATTFSKSGTIMFGVLTRLGNELVLFGKRMASSLTKGIRDGLSEYNLQIDATQTILSNVKDERKGINDVTDALDELNRYADKTIYNFSEMTRNIGMFTAAGTKLDTSVSTIKGLANAAAIVGASSQTASRAWYQVSQAMAAGTFRLMDWRSLETSNIAGEQFQEVIKIVARATKATDKHGRNIDKMIKKYGSLRDSLKEGWLTADRFAEAMSILSGDIDDKTLRRKGYTEKQIKKLRQIANEAEEAATAVKTFTQLVSTVAETIGSGWAETFRTMIGDITQAKSLFTGINNILTDFIEKGQIIRKFVVKKIFEDDGGRDKLKKVIDNTLTSFSALYRAFRAGWMNIFSIDRIRGAASKMIDFMTKTSEALTINQKSEYADLSEEEKKKKSLKGLEKTSQWNHEVITKAIENVIRIGRGAAAAIDIVWSSVRQFASFILQRIPFFKDFYKNLKEGNEGLLESAGKFADKITTLRNMIVNEDLITKVLEAIENKIKSIISEIPGLNYLFSFLKWIKTNIKNVFEALKNVDFSGVKKALNDIGTIIKKIFNTIISKDSFQVVIDIFNMILGFGKDILKGFGAFLSGFAENIDKTDARTKDLLSTVVKVTAAFVLLRDLITKIPDLAFFLYKLNVPQLFKYLTRYMKAKAFVETSEAIRNVALAVGLLTASLVVLSVIPFDTLIQRFSLLAIGILLFTAAIRSMGGGISVVEVALDSLSDLAKASVFATIAVAMVAIVAAMGLIKKMFPNPNELKAYIGAIIKLLIALTGAVVLITKAIGNFNSILGAVVKVTVVNSIISTIVGALLAMTAVLGIMSIIPEDKLAKAVTSLVVISLLITAMVGVFGLLEGMHTNPFKLLAVLGGISSVLVAITYCLTQLSLITMLPNVDILGAVGALSAMTAVVVGLTKLLGKFDGITNFGNVGKNILMMYSIAGLMGAMAFVIATVAVMPKGNIEEATNALGISVMNLISIFAAITIASNYVKNSLGTVLILTTLMSNLIGLINKIALVAVIFKTNEVSMSQIGMAAAVLGIAIAAIGLSIAELVAVSKIIQKNEILFKKIGTTWLVLGGVMGYITLISAEIVLMAIALKDVSWNQIGKSAAVFAASITSIVLIVKAFSGLATSIKTIGSLASFAALAALSASFISMIAIMAAAIAGVAVLLKDVSWEQLGKSGAAFIAGSAIFLGVIAGMITISKFLFRDRLSILSFITISGSINTFLIAMSVSLALVASAIKKLSNVNISNNTIEILKMYGIIIGVFMSLALIMNKMPRKLTFNFLSLAVALLMISVFAETLARVINGMLRYSKEMPKMGEKIGTAIGNFCLGVVNTLKNAIPALVKSIVDILYIFVKSLWNEVPKIAEIIGTAISAIFVLAFKIATTKVTLSNGITIHTGLVMALFGIDKIIQILTGKSIAQRLAIAFAGVLKTVLVNTLATYGVTISSTWGNILSVCLWKLGLFGEGVTVVNGVVQMNLKAMATAAGNLFVIGAAATVAFGVASAAVHAWRQYTHQELSYNNADIQTTDQAFEAFFTNNQFRVQILIDTVMRFANAIAIIFVGIANVFGTIFGVIEAGIRSTIEGFKNVENHFNILTLKLNKMKDPAHAKYYDEQIKEYEKRIKETEKGSQQVLDGIKLDWQVWLQNFTTVWDGLEWGEWTKGGEQASSSFTTAMQNQLSDGMGTYKSMFSNYTGEILGEQEKAVEEFNFNQYKEQHGLSNALLKLAEVHKDELVGKTKEEAKEILKQRILEATNNAEIAANASETIINNLMKQKVGEQIITEETAKDLVQTEADTTATIIDIREYGNKRLKEQLEDEYKMKKEEAYRSGRLRELEAKGLANLNTAEREEYKALLKQRELFNEKSKKFLSNNPETYDRARLQELQKKGLANLNTSEREEYKALENRIKNATSSSGGKSSSGNPVEDIWKKFEDMWKRNAPGDPDTSLFNVDELKKLLEKLNEKNKNKDKNKNPKDKAKDLKKDLEKERADLTPIIDLDKLSNEAHKASDIVTTSLLAAQNAAIGDYINKDSELNPFMKDRWQNVYNFTQNNYSPKALSRTDIYRQTQRQLNLSRGF